MQVSDVFFMSRARRAIPSCLYLQCKKGKELFYWYEAFCFRSYVHTFLLACATQFTLHRFFCFLFSVDALFVSKTIKIRKSLSLSIQWKIDFRPTDQEIWRLMLFWTWSSAILLNLQFAFFPIWYFQASIRTNTSIQSVLAELLSTITSRSCEPSTLPLLKSKLQNLPRKCR